MLNWIYLKNGGVSSMKARGAPHESLENATIVEIPGLSLRTCESVQLCYKKSQRIANSHFPHLERLDTYRLDILSSG